MLRTAGSPSADRHLLCAAAFLRAFATGLVGVGLGLHLGARGEAASTIGGVVSAGLLGNALASLLVTLRGDRHGRRRSFAGLAVLSASGAAAATFATDARVLALASCVGLVNGMGRDRGPAAILEQAALPGTVADGDRTRTFAWYNLWQDAGHALGSLLAGWSALDAPLLDAPGSPGPLVLAAILFALAGGLALRLGPSVEAAPAAARTPVSRRSRALVARISALFALDSLGGGFLTTTLVSYFFLERFGADAGTIGVLFFGARVLNAASHLGAAALARHFGLVNTMVFTHIPSSLLLMTAAVAPTFEVAALLFLAREGLVEMDVPTRQSYVTAVVAPEERTFASGVTQLVRMGAWAAAPVLAGLLMERMSLASPLVLGAALKIAYDLLLYRAFRHVRPPEERGR
jgi:MFS family permease